jgi:phosphoglycolate phosphatase-like HAD superfamily hydrolase
MGNDVHASKVEKIRMVFSKYNTDAEHCVFVTDTLGDIREANVLNVKSIGVSWGFHEKERLEIGNPFKIIYKPGELLRVINDAFSSK